MAIKGYLLPSNPSAELQGQAEAYGQSRRNHRRQRRQLRCEAELGMQPASDDYLDRTPGQTKTKVLDLNKGGKAFRLSHVATFKDFKQMNDQQRLDDQKRLAGSTKPNDQDALDDQEPAYDRVRLNAQIQQDVGHARLPRALPLFHDKLHDLSKDMPWMPVVPEESLVHGAYAQASRDRPARDAEEKMSEGPSWKRKEMFERLNPVRKAHFQEWRKRMAVQDDDHQSPATQQDETDRLLSLGESNGSRRVMWRTNASVSKPPSNSVQQAQKKMRSFLKQVRLERKADLPAQGFAKMVTPEEVEDGEEYDVVEFVKDDPLDGLFDQPDRPIGAFDKAEVDLYHERQRQEVVQGMRAKGFDEAAVDQMQERFLGMPVTALDEKADAARKTLIAAGKLLPPQQRASPKKRASLRGKAPATKVDATEQPPMPEHQQSRNEAVSKASLKRKADELDGAPVIASSAGEIPSALLVLANAAVDEEDRSPPKRQRRAPRRYRD